MLLQVYVSITFLLLSSAYEKVFLRKKKKGQFKGKAVVLFNTVSFYAHM